MIDIKNLVELKYVLMELGAPFVTMVGIIMMPVWYVDSWDTLLMVKCCVLFLSLYL